MIKVLIRTALAWIALQACWHGASAQDTSPEHMAPPPAATPAPAAEPARPVVPAPQMPADPLSTLKPAVDPPRPPITVPSAPGAPPSMTGAQPSMPVAPTPRLDASPITPVAPAMTRSIPAPLSPPGPAAPRPPSVDVDPHGKALGHDLDVMRRPGTSAPITSATSNAPGFRALKRLSAHEILGTSHHHFAIYVLRDSERTLVLDFPNTREQARMFARLILFIERGGASKTRVMTVPEVQKWLRDNAQSFDTLTVGNNMRTGELARFFNSARFQGEPLTVDEQRLYDWLVQSQLLREEEAGVSVVEPERILVSVPQVSSIAGCTGCTVTHAHRAVILRHELSHARFATDTVYQNYSIWFWANALTLSQRDKFTRFLRSRGYDTSIRELCANEMQAFLMHTPDPAMFSAADLGVSEVELADIRRKFAEGIAPRPRATAIANYQLD